MLLIIQAIQPYGDHLSNGLAVEQTMLRLKMFGRKISVMAKLNKIKIITLQIPVQAFVSHSHNINSILHTLIFPSYMYLQKRKMYFCF